MRLLPLLLFALSSIPPAFAASSPATPIVLPTGATIPVALSRPVWAATAAPGQLLYAQTLSPIAAAGQIAIPAGTFVEATVKALVKPTSKLDQALFQIQFNQLIFANGYVVTLSNPNGSRPQQIAYVTVKVTTANDLLFDEGNLITLTLRSPVSLDPTQVAAAVPLSHAPAAASFIPSTLCRFQPGSPGTPDTPPSPDIVIPGTPDTVIPGSDGAPDITIPGTPSTTIPGSPGSPGTPATDPVYCPDPPSVISSSPHNPLGKPAAPKASPK